MAKNFAIPDLSNATPSFLVDELRSTRAQAAYCKKYEGVLKQRLGAMRQKDAEENQGVTKDEYAGESGGKVLFSQGSRSTFDYKSFIEDHPELDFTAYWKSSTFPVIRTPGVGDDEK